MPDFHHHADHHPKRGGLRGHRGHRVVSLGASFGLSVLIWQHLLGIELHWMVLPISVIILFAVGSDYNLLLVSRFNEEIPAGLKTGIIRAMGGTGSVVTSAGLVFAFTMMTMAVSQLTSSVRSAPPSDSACCLTHLIVRSLMTPSIAALLGNGSGGHNGSGSGPSLQPGLHRPRSPRP